MNRAQSIIGRGNLHEEALAKLKEYGVPSHMHGGLIRWVEEGTRPGHFLTAVITNDLKTACIYADEQSAEGLSKIVMWLYNQAPSGCWGYEGALKHWTMPMEPEVDHG